MPYPVDLLPSPLPPLNSPEYVELSRKIARQTGAAARAPRTFAEALRRRAENRYRNLINRIFRELDMAIRQAPTVEAVQQAISKFIVSPRFDSMCRQAASQMVTMLAVGHMFFSYVFYCHFFNPLNSPPVEHPSPFIVIVLSLPL